jgi:hypothetical protein
MLHRGAILFTCALLGACSTVPAKRTPAPATSANTDVIQAMQFSSYMTALQTVVQGSPAEQAEVVANARGGYEQAHQGPAALRYGLLVATPGHPDHDPQLAQRLLHEALARPELLSPVERALAIVEVSRVEQEISLTSENARLVSDAQQERERARSAPSVAALAKRLQDETAESARLRKELEDAKAKLDAIANIERSIPERTPAKETRKP